MSSERDFYDTKFELRFESEKKDNNDKKGDKNDKEKSDGKSKH